MPAEFIGRVCRSVLGESQPHDKRRQRLQSNLECRLRAAPHIQNSPAASSLCTKAEEPEGRLLLSAAWVGWWLED